jgi:hypothetical protein
VHGRACAIQRCGRRVNDVFDQQHVQRDQESKHSHGSAHPSSVARGVRDPLAFHNAWYGRDTRLLTTWDTRPGQIATATHSKS